MKRCFLLPVSEIYVKNGLNSLTSHPVLTEVGEYRFKSVPEILDVGST